MIKEGDVTHHFRAQSSAELQVSVGHAKHVLFLL
jgi:hypothetical protein